MKSKGIKYKPSGFKVESVNEKLFDFQADMVMWALEKGKAALFTSTGSGKTAMQLEWAKHVAEHTKGNVLILAPLAVAQQTVREGIKFDVVVHLCRTQDDVKPGVNITNYEMLHHFSTNKFDGVVLDECFPGDTPIDVLINDVKTYKYIKDIQKGDVILNASGIDEIENTCKRQIDRAIQINVNRQRITSSENHPYFTLHGWKPAKDIQPGDYIMATETAMCMVRGSFSSEICSSKNAEVLRKILFSEMENGGPGEMCESTHRRNKEATGHIKSSVVQERFTNSNKRNRATQKLESDAISRSEEKGIGHTAGHESQAECTGRKRETNANPTTDNVRCTGCGVVSRIRSANGIEGERISNKLQNRHSKSTFDDRNRSRRGITLQQERTGQKEGHEAQFFRVDDTEVLEQGHPELEKHRDASGNIYFYDIEATQHPSFSVNGLLVHNSSILKSFGGKTRTQIIDSFRNTEYKLACTATPSPNAVIELTNHCEFIGAMSGPEMLSTFFVHDTDGIGQWRLKGHSEEAFWQWMSTWSIMMSNPADLGYDGSKFNLPPLNTNEIVVDKTGYKIKTSLSLNERRAVRKESISSRVGCTEEIVTNDLDSKPNKWLIWCNLNAEQSALKKQFGDLCVSIEGSTPHDKRLEMEIAWREGEVPIMITKPKVFGFGVNWQHCNKMVFVGLDDSFESRYQATRRCWRFGQTEPVDVYIITSEKEGPVIENIKRKERQFNEMLTGMIAATQEINTEALKSTDLTIDEYNTDVTKTDNSTLYLGDNIEVIRSEIEDNSIDYSVFSPPFSSLFTYSDSIRDFGNCRSDEEFYNHFGFLSEELLRIIKPGRLVTIHCMLLPTSLSHDGMIGLNDFRGDLIRIMQETGFIFHSEVTIYKDPVQEMYRTKSIRLLHKQLKKDSAMSGMGRADYLITFRKPGTNAEPIEHTNDTFPVPMWQRYADPVWMNINQMDVLSKTSSREKNDEKHICPLQLDAIGRCIDLWSNPGDTVFDPFVGIGSVSYRAVLQDRKGIGIELKESYYSQACDNMKKAEYDKLKPKQVGFEVFE